VSTTDTESRAESRVGLAVLTAPVRANGGYESARARSVQTGRADRNQAGKREPPNGCVTCNMTCVASTRQRVREHRERLRAQGLRPVQIWVPDVRAPEFVAEAHRQSAAIAASEHEADDQAFVDAVSVDWATADGESTA
jgi:Protein  of unknown function (DUF3018)